MLLELSLGNANKATIQMMSGVYQLAFIFTELPKFCTMSKNQRLSDLEGVFKDDPKSPAQEDPSKCCSCVSGGGLASLSLDNSARKLFLILS